MKRHALTGVAGFVAPRHLDAIKATQGDLILALDPRDAAGILDKHFPICDFQTEPERFWRLLETTKRCDVVTIASPNHLHVDQVFRAVNVVENVICEKPVAITHWDLDALLKLDQKHRITPVLQLRYAPEVEALRQESLHGLRQQVVAVYHTPRGIWYDKSWKGELLKSGGLAVNIGVHLFDLLTHVFGSVEKRAVVFENSVRSLSGRVSLQRADVFFHLSIEPWETARRELRVSGLGGEKSVTLDFGPGLHKKVYEQMGGLRIADAEAGLRLAIDLSARAGVGSTPGELAVLEGVVKS